MKKSFEKMKVTLSFVLDTKNFKYYWSQIVIVLAPVLFVLFPNMVKFISKYWYLTALTIIFLIVCVVNSLGVSREYLEKTNLINELERKMDGMNLFLQTAPERVIKSIFQYLDFGYNERISVYRYENSHFVNIGRYSKNIEYKKGGRERYPYTEGFISIAWNTGECVIEDLPDPEKQYKSYIKEIRNKSNIDEKTISDMRMKSRSFYCLNLDNLNGDPIAVIVFESINEKLPKKTTEIKHLLDSSFGHLIVDMINMNLPLGRRVI